MTSTPCFDLNVKAAFYVTRAVARGAAGGRAAWLDHQRVVADGVSGKSAPHALLRQQARHRGHDKGAGVGTRIGEHPCQHRMPDVHRNGDDRRHVRGAFVPQAGFWSASR